MKVAVLGSGGREHALVWKLSQSERIKELFCIPGNPGIAPQHSRTSSSPRPRRPSPSGSQRRRSRRRAGCE